ncbi:MAG: hypothetical protein HKN24_03885 [Acidimicrobiales bacterium]|nr:hypothetical protein [Acidimicrobiales bacterium]
MRRGRRMRTTLATVTVTLVACLTLSACGGDDEETETTTDSTTTLVADAEPDDSGAGDADATTDTAESAAEDVPEEDAQDAGDFDFGTGVARVTIGDTSYEFDLTTGFTVCQDIFGGLQVAGNDASGDANVEMWIPPTDWETYTDGRYDPPSIIVEDDTLNVRWIADSNRVELIPDWPAASNVDSYTKDGNASTGTATFVDDYSFSEGEPVAGTFEVACEN